MNIFQPLIQTISRFCISSVFLAGGIKNIFDWHQAETGLITMLSDWQAYFGFSQMTQYFFSEMIAFSSLLLLLATALSLIGGSFILLGFKTKLGALLLIFFLIPVTLLYHPFWWTEGALYELQVVMFLKNLAILGCLFQMFLLPKEKPQNYFSEDSLPPMGY